MSLLHCSGVEHPRARAVLLLRTRLTSADEVHFRICSCVQSPDGLEGRKTICHIAVAQASAAASVAAQFETLIVCDLRISSRCNSQYLASLHVRQQQ